MVSALLIRGLLAGLLAGILGFCFAAIVGEPTVNTAISYQSYVEETVHHEAPEAELVSRPLQGTAGLGTGALIFGVAIGGMFALAFAAAYGRLGALSARGTAALLGALGFTAVYLAPFLKYPPNPPSIGDPDTIQYRTLLYLTLLLVSLVLMVGAVMFQRRLVGRVGGWNATLLAGGTYLVAMLVCYGLFPGINEVPQQAVPTVIDAVTDADITFPPTVLWAFRTASLGLQVVVWGTIALVFGALAQRLLEPSSRPVREQRTFGTAASAPRP